MLSTTLLLLAVSAATPTTPLPRDSTTAWCASVGVSYHSCFANPLGARNWIAWYRLRTNPGIQGCLDSEVSPFWLVGTPDTTEWFEIRQTNGPIVPRFAFFEQENCDVIWNGAVRNTAKMGDSLLLEFRMTPADTVVADTLRGDIHAIWEGVHEHIGVGSRQNPSQLLGWTGLALALPEGVVGEVRMRRLDGRVAIRAVRDPAGAFAIPERVPSPGLYAVVWSNGSGLVSIPPR